MKNIHILSTEKPSKLWKTWELKLGLHPTITHSLLGKQHIYITSDEEIKDGDYYYDNIVLQVRQWKSFMIYNSVQHFKIILTTDQDLINDGVQEIDNEFLEWFVKNPNCEFINVDEKTPDEIEVELNIHGHDIGLTDREFDEWLNNGGQLYKIIIPKKEPKTMLESLQEYLKNTPKEKVLEDWNEFQHLDEEGITVNEFLENQKQIDEKEK